MDHDASFTDFERRRLRASSRRDHVLLFVIRRVLRTVRKFQHKRTILRSFQRLSRKTPHAINALLLVTPIVDRLWTMQVILPREDQKRSISLKSICGVERITLAHVDPKLRRERG